MSNTRSGDYRAVLRSAAAAAVAALQQRLATGQQHTVPRQRYISFVNLYSRTNLPQPLCQLLPKTATAALLLCPLLQVVVDSPV
jgi:hypothetical protein